MTEDPEDTRRPHLVTRLLGGRIDPRDLAELVLETQGITAFTTESLERMAAILSILEEKT